MSDDFAFLDATAQAALVRSGQVSPLELVDAAIARIDALDGRLNAVIHRCFEQARTAATAPSLPDGPFRGVPFLVKDIGTNQDGLPYWMGNRALRAIDHRPPGDSVLGARFRAAGLVTLGKSNLPELGSSPTTQPLSFGPTNNPWDLTRSPSGSSGGAAAAVAAGLVPMAHANDGGGSTRLPAAWCGLVGLKPSRGRMPSPGSISRLSVELVVSRTVRDTAAIFEATYGPVPADLYHLPAPVRPFTQELGRPVPAGLRVAFLLSAGTIDVDPACAEAVRRAAAVLAEAGHDVVEVDDSVLFGPASQVNGQLWQAGITRRVDELSDRAGRPMSADDVEPYNWTAAEKGRSQSASDWTRAQEQQQAWVASVYDWLSGFDVLVTPTAGCPPLTTEELWPAPEAPWRIGRTYARIGAFTLPFNATGHPAISLPLYETAEGLPVGVQFVAGLGREDLLLRLASFFEDAMPWRDRRPAVHA